MEKNPFYIVEIGSGHGKFGFLFLRQLEELRDEFPIVDKIKYIMTDFTDSNITFLRQHEALKRFIDNGKLDFAQFDAEKGTELKLIEQNIILNPDTIKNPMTMVANYLFDTLSFDAFRVQHEKIHEGLVSVVYKQPEIPKIDDKLEEKKLDQDEVDVPKPIEAELENLTIDCTDVNLDKLPPNILDLIEAKWKFDTIDPKTYYANPIWSKVLEWYANNMPTSTILMPTGAFRCIETFLKLSNSKLMILSGDKGISHLEAMHVLDPPYLAIHGSFSFMVNYHAISLLFKYYLNDSQTMHASIDEGTLKVACYTSMRYDRVVRRFKDICQFGPLDFFFLQNNMKADSSTDIKAIMSMIRLSYYDTDTFFKFIDMLVEQAQSTLELQLMDAKTMMSQIWKNYYHLDISKDIPFEFGRLHFAFTEYELALHYYISSHLLFGANHVTYYNIAITLYELGDLLGCETICNLSLELNTTYDRTLSWLERVKDEIRTKFENMKPFYPDNEEDKKKRIENEMSRIIPNYFIKMYISDE